MDSTFTWFLDYSKVKESSEKNVTKQQQQHQQELPFNGTDDKYLILYLSDCPSESYRILCNPTGLSDMILKDPLLIDQKYEGQYSLRSPRICCAVCSQTIGHKQAIKAVRSQHAQRGTACGKI